MSPGRSGILCALLPDRLMGPFHSHIGWGQLLGHQLSKVSMMESDSGLQSLPWSLGALPLRGHLSSGSPAKEVKASLRPVILSSLVPIPSRPHGFPTYCWNRLPWGWGNVLSISLSEPLGASESLGREVGVGEDLKGFSAGNSDEGPSLLHSSGWPHVPHLRFLQFVTGWQQESDAEAAAGLHCRFGQSLRLLWLLPRGLHLLSLSQPGPRPRLSITHVLFLPALQVQGRMKISLF